MQHDSVGGGAAPETCSPATKRTVLIATTVSAFITPFLVSSVNIAIPTITQEFSLNAIMMSWVVTAYLLSATIFLVPFGRIADIWGRKKIYLAGNALIAVSSFLAARATSCVMLVSARTLEGVAAAMIFGAGIGRLSDRVEPRLVASLGMGMCAVGLALLIGINSRTPLGYVVGCLILLGLGFAPFSSPNTNAVMSSVGKQFYGVASGTPATMRLTGQMLSMGIVTMLMALFIGTTMIAPRTYPLFLMANRTAFIIFAVLCALGVLASLARGRVHTEMGDVNDHPGN